MTKPLRVVVLHDYSEKRGGASYLVGMLVRRLRDAGHRVTFIAGDDGTGFNEDDIELVPVGARALLEKSKISAMTTGIYNADTARVVQDWIARNDTPETVYHLHGWSKILSPSVFRALAPVKARTILHAHDYFLACPNGGYFNFQSNTDCALTPLSGACLASACDKNSRAQKMWRVGREVVRRQLDRSGGAAARILTLHPGMIPSLVRGGLPADRLFAVRNPVVPYCAEPVAAETNRKVAFIGRISREKGADLAAEAAKKAGVPIDFIGTGSDVDAVRSINPDAHFTGWLDEAGLAAAVREARVVVMPSRWSEPFGLVALEAIGSGIPVIMADSALLAPEVAAAGLGHAVAVRDIDAFAGLLNQLAGDDDEIARMSRAGPAGYLQFGNTPEGWTEALTAHYREILASA